ncbi:MAG: MFS transporter, partial [Candidatus Aenigmarchaeota archaeon]|nr:MFS transporter [Candidatus Aenigmarchaeota archaeon]
FYSIDSAQTKAYISDLSTKQTRATAIGVYNLTTGIVYLPASIIAGLLWKYLGPQYTFGFAALVSLIALIVFVVKMNTRIYSRA